VKSQELGTINQQKQLLARWKEHLSEGSVNLRDDGVDIDFPSREKIEGTLKYLKNNKATWNNRKIRDVGKPWQLATNTLKSYLVYLLYT
jgi:hypothetical protein